MPLVFPPVHATLGSFSLETNSIAQQEINRAMTQATGIAMDIFGLPFDMARAQYARAVQVGLIERSMLASRDFSRTLSSMEQLTLGPWARRV